MEGLLSYKAGNDGSDKCFILGSRQSLNSKFSTAAIKPQRLPGLLFLATSLLALRLLHYTSRILVSYDIGILLAPRSKIKSSEDIIKSCHAVRDHITKTQEGSESATQGWRKACPSRLFPNRRVSKKKIPGEGIR